MKATQLNGKKGMSALGSITLTLVMVIALHNITFAQTGKLYLKGESKTKMTNEMVTAQYGNGINTKKEKKQPAKIIATPTQTEEHAIEGDKYLKTKEAGKKYTSFEVYDVQGMNKQQMMMGLMTNSVDRGTRYNDKGLVTEKTVVTAAAATKVNVKETLIANEKNTKVSFAKFGDKVFVIVGENDYRYMDGKVLEGKQKLVTELMKGKPVTETTFYFELKKAGIINMEMTQKQFSNLSKNQKQLLLNGGTPIAAL